MSKYSSFRDRYMPALWPIAIYWDWDINSFFNIKESGYHVQLIKNGYLNVYFEDKTHQIMSKIGIEKLANCTEQIQRKKSAEVGKKCLILTKQFAKKSEKSSIKEYINFLNQFHKAYVKIMKENMILWHIAEITLGKKLEEKITNKEHLHELLKLTQPTYSKLIEEKLTVLQYKQEQKRDIKKDVNIFCKKYFWFPYEYVGPRIWTKEDVYQMLENHKPQPKENYKAIKKKQQEILKLYDKETIMLVKVSHLSSILQDDRKQINAHICYYLNGTIFNNLAEKLGVQREEALYADENILKLFLKNQEAARVLLKSRVKKVLNIFRNGKRFTYEDHEIEDALKKIKFEYPTHTTEIKGQIAMKGKAVGKVKIMYNSQEGNLQKGEILVTGMTTPDFMSHIKKAAAIVTNEGGITCHAAVIARELKIPCIIATGNATKIFKDGDVIEVDANTGVVRKVKE